MVEQSPDTSWNFSNIYLSEVRLSFNLNFIFYWCQNIFVIVKWCLTYWIGRIILNCFKNCLLDALVKSVATDEQFSDSSWNFGNAHLSEVRLYLLDFIWTQHFSKEVRLNLKDRQKQFLRIILIGCWKVSRFLTIQSVNFQCDNI